MQISRAAMVFACVLAASEAYAAPPGNDEAGKPEAAADDAPVPQESFFSSIKQAFKQDFDHEVVRGHFDVGSPPDVHRYYCLVDPKSGKREPNGVPGQPAPRPDGMTGIKASSVSLYSCASSEQQGILVTEGYRLIGAAARVPAPRPTAAASPEAGAQVPKPAAVPDTMPGRIDVAGVRLGMSVDEVRAVLRSKHLMDYRESMGSLAPVGTGGSANAAPGGRYMNTIASWTLLPGSEVGDSAGESYEVVFTPVPGRERAMAIVHTVAYAPGGGIRESVLKEGLVKKYGGFAGGDSLPVAPTWRVQRTGEIAVGDTCERRSLFGGLGDLQPRPAGRPNPALKTTPDEFRHQIDRCGATLVTEDHATSGGAAGDAHLVSRFTVSAYSPVIGFDGATAAAQVMLSAGEPEKNVSPPRSREKAAPEL